MHDTFLNERIYESLIRLSNENGISRLRRVNIAVNTDSHITENSLRDHFSDRGSKLIGDWTEITVEKRDVGKLNAVINSIEGESPDE
jgi:Zn finger protein HypA/HybF involved in hydrogenase expression